MDFLSCAHSKNYDSLQAMPFHRLVKTAFILLSVIVCLHFFKESSAFAVSAETEQAALTLRVIEDNEISRINGKYLAFDIGCDEFLEKFSYDDIVKINVNGHSYLAPVCDKRPSVVYSQYYVFLNKTSTYMFGKNFDHIYLAATEVPLQVESGVFTEGDDGYIFSPDVDRPLYATVELYEKNGFAPYNEIASLVRTLDREDYPDLSDEEFANFRMVSGGSIADGILYRSSSPIDSVFNRNTYADTAAQKAQVHTIINLANNEDDAQKLEGFSDTYYSRQNVYYRELPVALTFDEFEEGLLGAFRFMSENKGPYLIHCVEERYRTGVMVALIECIMGAELETIEQDHLKTYQNFYNVSDGVQTPVPQALEPAVNELILSYLELIFDVDKLDPATLSEDAERYLMKIGMTIDEITRLKENLSLNVEKDGTETVNSTAPNKESLHDPANQTESVSVNKGVSSGYGTNSVNSGDHGCALPAVCCAAAVCIALAVRRKRAGDQRHQ